jgi:hypothetical protein
MRRPPYRLRKSQAANEIRSEGSLLNLHFYFEKTALDTPHTRLGL